MIRSINLCKIFGIQVRIHITFFILPLFFLMMGGVKSMVLVLIVFICVTMHELTHSLVAMSFGITVKDITLLPIGGVASMNKMPNSPKQEFLISIAGPLFNIVLAGVLLFVFYYSPWMPKRVLFHPASGNSWLNTIAMVPWINITLAVFNLLPAFPMDGGRVLRSIMASRIDYRKATRIAVNIGHIFAILFAYLGFKYNYPMLFFIAIFIYMSASAEESQVNLKETLKDYKVKDILNTQYASLEKDTPLYKVFELVFHTHQEDFPVLENGVMIGFVTRADIIKAIHSSNKEDAVFNIMRRDLPSVVPEDKLMKVQRIMEETGARALPVARGSFIFGIVTLEDIGRVYSIMARR